MTAMERSLMMVGQITPLVVHASGHGYEVLDGFKRLRAARSLKWSCLWVQVMRLGAVQAKLHLCQSNRAGGLTEIEEAWVVRSLYREDGLTQPEIGRLMVRNKSWVNRRLLLAEALGEELQVDLRIGLISATTARELCRLPRDNQQEVATTVKQRGLTTRQTQTLVEAWLAAPTESARESLLTTVRGTQEGKEARRPRTSGEWMLYDGGSLPLISSISASTSSVSPRRGTVVWWQPTISQCWYIWRNRRSASLRVGARMEMFSTRWPARVLRLKL